MYDRILHKERYESKEQSIRDLIRIYDEIDNWCSLSCIDCEDCPFTDPCIMDKMIVWIDSHFHYEGSELIKNYECEKEIKESFKVENNGFKNKYQDDLFEEIIFKKGKIYVEDVSSEKFYKLLNIFSFYFDYDHEYNFYFSEEKDVLFYVDDNYNLKFDVTDPHSYYNPFTFRNLDLDYFEKKLSKLNSDLLKEENGNKI